MHSHIISCIIKYYQVLLSYIIMHYHMLSWIIMYYHLLIYIIMHYHVLSWLISSHACRGAGARGSYSRRWSTGRSSGSSTYTSSATRAATDTLAAAVKHLGWRLDGRNKKAAQPYCCGQVPKPRTLQLKHSLILLWSSHIETHKQQNELFSQCYVFF